MAIVTDVEAVNRDVTDIMKQIYGDRLAAVILFGSYARGDFHEDSDVDYLVLLTDETVNLSKEISRLSHDLNAIFLKDDIRVSVKPIPAGSLKANNPLYAEVRREGKSIYERAISQVH